MLFPAPRTRMSKEATGLSPWADLLLEERGDVGPGCSGPSVRPLSSPLRGGQSGLILVTSRVPLGLPPGPVTRPLTHACHFGRGKPERGPRTHIPGEGSRGAGLRASAGLLHVLRPRWPRRQGRHPGRDSPTCSQGRKHTELRALPVRARTPDRASRWPPAPSGGGQTSSAAPTPVPRARRHRQAISSTLEPG